MDVHAPGSFPLSWGLACLQDTGTQMCRHTQHRGAGWWRGPGLLVPGWPHPVSLTHVSSHLCSPQIPVTCPLCVSQAAQQVSRSTQVASQGHLHPSLAALSGDCSSLWCPLEWAEPCSVPGSRCWVPPATPSECFLTHGPSAGQHRMAGCRWAGVDWEVQGGACHFPELEPEEAGLLGHAIPL